ncbi:hypothetical protein BAU15_05620 [Enterococcus sp. JM4C]|uniref:Cna B-type domain-containing protein n=1 Tax=Candidatus Enterococcus huntleyi TaxID=1857217 RepID=UPI00137A0D9C|nr:Cna B-type domain-containing protein [Enterococcus sp. JM4C]KAF1295227.1 hypothetical protein BAU15_05620 [Enterococcus sp. JM4C]
MERLRKVLTIIGLLGILANIMPVNAFAVSNNEGIRFSDAKIVDTTGNEITENNLTKKAENVKVVLDWELATSSKVNGQLLITKQLPTNLNIPDQSGVLGNDLGSYQVQNKQLSFILTGYSQESADELISESSVVIKDFRGKIEINASTINEANASTETVAFENQLTRTLFYEQETVASSSETEVSTEEPANEATEETAAESTEASTEESKADKEDKKETKNGKATFAADLSASVSIDGLKVYKKPIGQHDWTPVPAGGSIMLGDSVKFEVDWSIPNLTAVTGDTLKIPLSVGNFSFKNTNPQDLITDGVVIGQWRIEGSHFTVVFNDKIESKDLLKNGTVEAIGAANKVGDNSHIIINGTDMMEVDIVPAPVIEIPDDPWPVGSDIMKAGLVSGGSLNQIGWIADVNFKSMREYYETGNFPVKDNFLFIDELAEGTSFADGSLSITSSIKSMYDNKDGTFTMGQIQVGTGVPITHPSFSKITPNVGESKESFKGRVVAGPQLTYGVYKDSNGIETLYVNYGSLPSASNQIKYKKDVALTGIDKLYNEGKLTVAGRERLLEFLEDIDFQAPAFRMNFRVDVKAGTNHYKNKIELEWDGGSVNSNESTVRYEDVTAGVQTGEKGSIRILKKDALGTVLPGIEFKLQVKNGAGVFIDYTPIDGGTAIRATDSTGLVEYKKLNPGVYRLVELVDFTDPDSEFYQATSKITTPIGVTTTTDEFEIKESDSKGFVANVVNHRQLQKTVTKVWNDGDNQDGLHPNSVQVQLLADGVAKGSPVTLNAGNNWSHTWKELPEANQNTVINYTVQEVGTVPGYTATITTDDETGDVTVTNTHEPALVDVDGSKTWADSNDQDGLRPDSITVELYADNALEDSKNVTAATSWEYQFANLPKYKNGVEINYTIKEVAVPNYTTTINGFDITNSYIPKQTSVAVEKVWDDADNQDGLRPNSIAVQLYANGTATGTPLTLNAGNQWKASWPGLPEKAAGQTITYTVAEVGNITGYTTEVTEGDPGKFTITNSHTPEKTSVAGEKTWDDADNQDGIRPTSITVNLLADGEVVKTKNVTANGDGEWLYSFEDLDKYNAGHQIVYTVTEETVADYTTSYSGFDITNSYTPGETGLSVLKVWADANNQDGLRPTSVQVQLYADDVAKGAPVTLNEGNNWAADWENLPEKAAGQTIVYTVREVGNVAGYTTVVNADDPSNVVITNTHTPEEIEIKGKKTWDDADDQDGIRPDEITVNLFANGSKVADQTVSATEEWKYIFTGLPKFENGVAINYTISEELVPGYTFEYTGFDIKNSYTPGETAVNVTKSWNDANNQDGLRPDSIQVQLYANGEALGAPVTLTSQDGWDHTWDELPEKAAGQTILYTVEEVGSIPGYTTSINSADPANVIITNTHTSALVDVDGSKTWDDADNQDGIRPDSITVNLLANGVKIDSKEVKAEHGWEYAFENLPKFANGQEITYSITEEAVPGYTFDYTGFDITNSYTPGETGLSVKKVWADANNQDGIRPTSVQVQLKADGAAEGAPVTLDEDNEWKANWTGLPEKANGQTILYTVEEVGSVAGYTTVVNADDPANVVITNTHKPEEIEIEGEKHWEDANNQDGIQPDSITVELNANGLKVKDQVVSENENWEYKFTGLPKYENGVAINYTISEEVVPGYTVDYTDFDITNSYTPGKTGATVNKVWADANDQDGLRPDTIQVQLKADGVAHGAPITLSSADGWSYSWTDLDEKANGTTIVYTVEEIGSLPGYTTVVNNNNPANLMITNSHTPETISINGEKHWDDADNQDGIRPDSIIVNLNGNGQVVATQTVTPNPLGEWVYEFTDLPKFENGQEINYTISENAVPNYSADYTGFDITNSYTPGKTSVTVTKAWNDANNQDGIRPTSIDVQLLADGVAKGAPITLTAGMDWSYTWPDLDEKAAGQTIVYTVVEVGTINDYTTQITNNGPTNFTITNTHAPEKTSVSGEKHWDDADNQDGIRPTTIEVNLWADGVKVDSKTIADNAGHWTYEFTNLDKYQAGNVINYTVTEEAVPNYTVSYDDQSFDMTNSYTPGKTAVSVQKVWNDANNQDGLRPDSIDVQLYADGQAKGAPVTLNEAGLWKHTWDTLDEKAAGQTIDYTVEEVGSVTGYTTTKNDNDPKNVSIINQHTPELIDVIGSKTWADANDQDGVRPANITVRLWANGEEIDSKVVSADDSWDYIFENLPKFANGSEIVYAITEDTVPNYTTDYTNFDITNSYTPGKTTVKVTKIWNDAEDQDGLRPATIDVQLFANGVEKDAPVTLTSGDGWSFEWAGLDEKAAGQPIVYTVKEIGSVTGYTTVVDDDDHSAITIANSHTPELTEVTGEKTWDDADNQDGIRPDKIIVNLLADGEKVASQDVEANDEGKWLYQFTDLDKYKNGQEIDYTITEEAVPSYTVSYNGHNITNSYTPGKTGVTVKKVWADANNQDGLRPTSIDVQLYANGSPKGAPVTLTGDEWSHNWTGLDEKAGGQPIVYTVQEVGSVTGYTTVVDNDDPANITITNTHIPELTEVSGLKTWDDADDQDGIRPNSIVVNLLANGVKIDSKTVTAADGWAYKFEELDKFEAGTEINYTVTEEAVPSYTPSYQNFDITNSYTPGQTSVSVQKVWEDADDQDGLRPTSIDVQLYADGVAKGAPVTLTGDGWSHQWIGLDEKAAGQPIVYTVKEVDSVTGYTTVIDNDDHTNITITNTHIPELTEVTGEKHWDDADDQDGVRPSSVTVNLLANGVKVDSKVINEDNFWEYAFIELDKYEAGQEITYTITEDTVPNYSVSYNGFDITNSYTPGQTSVSVLKAWNDADNQDGIQPTSIEVQLYADDVAYGAPETLTAGGNWSHTWQNLDEKAAGQPIVYTVQEVGSVTGYTTVVTEENPGNFTITNSHTPELTEVTGEKHWDDADNQDGIRPDSIIVNLLANGVEVDSQEVEADGEGNWKYTFTDLDKYEAGQEITYTVTEDTVPNYSVDYSDFDIFNSYTPGQTSMSVQKVWDDANNQDGLRPTSIEVQLYADGVEKDAPVTLNEDNQWKHTWGNLDEKSAGQPIDYTVQEVTSLPGYTTSQTTTPGNVTITNSHTPALVDVNGAKTWDDADDQDGVRPDSITVNLLANGVKIDSQVVSGGSWDYGFTNLPKFENGVEINYTISEDTVPSYTTTYEGFNITNSYTPGKTSVTVTKAWNDAGNQDGIRPTSIQVQLFADGTAYGTPMTLTSIDNWSYTWVGLDEKAAGQPIVYTVEEIGTVPGYTKTKDDTDPANVTITNSHTPAEVSVEGSKTWNDADDQDGVRPTSIIVNLLADGLKIDSRLVEDDGDGNWTYSFAGLPKFANGQEIAYTITEDTVPNYTTTYQGFDITNSYTPGQTGVTVTKVWNDADNQDGLRPDSIEVQLYADGVEKGAPVTLTSLDNWSYTWTDLDEKSGGQTIVYTVQEVDSVPGYTTVVNNDNHTITNSHTPELTEVTGEKHWNDANNQDGIRPDSITVNLLANGVKVDSLEVEADGEGNWAYEFTGLDKFEAGQEIDYTVTEEAVPNYTVSYNENDFDITNSYTPGQTSVSVFKVWDDANNQDGLQPTSIDVQLYADDTAYGAPITLTAGTGWSHTWGNLDEKAAGQPIVYRVEEVGSVPGYTTTKNDTDSTNVIITNSHTPAEVTVEGEKNWDDANNQDGVRPTSIMVNLHADGLKIKNQEVEADEEGNWTYKFADLPKFANGSEINYTITEDAVPNYSTTIVGTSITNSYTPGQTSLTVNKAWADANNQDGIRPASVQVQLFADGVAKGAPETLTAPTWTHTWGNLDEKAAGQAIEYTVQEVGTVSGYTALVDATDPMNVLITNSHTPELTQVSGEKTWDDANNQDGVRPNSIIVNLLANGLKVDSQEVEADDEGKWTYEFTGLDKYEAGQEINYTITEDTVPNYSVNYSGFDITNSYTPGLRNVSVLKTWDDMNNQDGIQPTSIQVQLFADGTAKGAPVTLTAGTGWTHTWEDLDEKAAGQAIVYTVAEVGTVTGYTTVVTEETPGNFTILNTHAPEQTQVSGEKTWNDANNQDGVRPTSIMVNLLANGTPVASQEVTEDDDWRYEFTGLDKYENGLEIDYTITEDVVPNYSTDYQGFDITNSYTPGQTAVTVIKAWDDAANQDGLRPESIEVQLYADNVAKGAPVTLTEDNSWTHTWDNLDEKAAGQTIVYTVAEVGTVAGYTAATTTTPGTVVITNSHTPAEVDVNGAKTWDDANDQDGFRPASITVNLLADGVKIDSLDVTEADSWEYAFTNLPKFANGTEIDYTITEDAVPNYSVTYEGHNMTNSHTPGQTGVNVTKVWADANDQDGLRPTSIEVQLYADDVAYGAPITLTSENNWTHSWTDLDEKANGQTIAYTVQEVGSVTGYTTAVDANDPTNVVITNSHTPAEITVNGAKTWNDADNQDGVRPENITVNLLADGEKVASQVVTADDNGEWRYAFTDLPKFANGSEIDYVITEEAVPNYSVTYNGFDIENSYTPGQTAVSVNKVWADADNQDGLRPDSIEVQLYADGAEKGAPVTLNEENSWRHTWGNLDEKSSGQTIDYTVEEVGTVAGYTTVKDDEDRANVVITNSHTTEETQVTGSKTWADANNQDGLRPTTITVNLLANDVKVASQVVTDDGFGNWNYSFTNLDKYENGQVINYTITEDAVANYTTEYAGYDITNSHTPAQTEVSGAKTWNDANNQDGVRPDSITVNLLANDEKVDSQEVTADEEGNWTYAFTNLDKFVDGQEITYTVSEEAVPNYTTTYEGFDITNSYTPGQTTISVNKVWADENNQDGLRPDSIDVQLFADGVEKGEAITLNEANSWTHTWTDLAEKADGKAIVYTVEEVGNVTGYTTAVDDADPANVVITNSHTPATTEVTGSKTWNDANNQDGVRPDSITVNLLADGVKVASQEVKADKEDNWNYSFTDLPEFANGQAIVYSISEEVVANYTTTYEGFDITNSYTPGKTGVTVTKIWADANDQDGLRPETIAVQLFADGEKQGEEITLNAANSWTHTWTDLAEKADGTVIDYTVEEAGTVAGYTTAVDASNPANVVITNSHTPETTEVTGSKTWNDADNQDGVRPEAITVNLLADGEKVASQEVKADKEGNWNYSFTDLPEFAKGQAIIYTVSEEAVTNYTTTYEGFDITNSYTPGQTGVTVTKVWADGEDKDGLRPTTIQVQLFADGKATGEPVTLDAEMNWKHTWTELAEKADGKAIAYTVEEVSEVEGYTATVDASDPANVVITNHHTPKVDDRLIQIIGQKTWVDEDNKAGARPTSITINLLADGVKVDSREVTAETDWAYSFDNLQELADERPIVYTISEEAVENYTPIYDGFDVVNHYTPETTSLTVNKVWDDSNDKDKLRAKSIEVQLLANGQPVEPIVTLSEENNWTASWTELAKEADGKVIEYTVEEISEVKGYVATVTKLDETNQTITNKHTPEVKQPDPKDPTEPKAPAKPVTPVTPKAPKKDQPKKQLPKTGEVTNPFVSYLGVSLIAFVALIEQRRRAQKSAKR